MSERQDGVAGGLGERWLADAARVLERISGTQGAAIETASRMCADAIAGDGLVHLFGTGHSRVGVEEMFPRYGSFPGFHPIADLSMTFHTQVVGANGQRQALFIERVAGLAEVVLRNFRVGPPDVMMVFSASGANTVPVEMAVAARRSMIPVVAVTSVAQSLATPSNAPDGSRLLDHADVVLDLCTPARDATVPLGSDGTVVGPTSTLAAVAIANAVKCRTAELLHDRGCLPPVMVAPAGAEGLTANARADAAYAEHARRVGRILR